MIGTYEELGTWLLENGFNGEPCIVNPDNMLYRNYKTIEYSECLPNWYRVENALSNSAAVIHSKGKVKILSYEDTKQYLIKELKMNDVTPEELEVKPLKSVEPDHVELFKKQLDNAEGIIYQLVTYEGLDINDLDQFFDLRDSLLNQESDFEATIDDETYRFIHEDKIEEIFKEISI